MPFTILLFLFIVVPMSEIFLLISVGGSIGAGNTILLVIVTAILGAWLVRQQGLATITNLQQQSARGVLPAMEIAEGVLLLFAGAVLLTPGFITDALGFTLLMPWTRRGLIRNLAKRGVWNVQSAHYSSNASDNDGSYNKQSSKPNIIEGEFHNKD